MTKKKNKLSAPVPVQEPEPEPKPKCMDTPVPVKMAYPGTPERLAQLESMPLKEAIDAAWKDIERVRDLTKFTSVIHQALVQRYSATLQDQSDRLSQENKIKSDELIARSKHLFGAN